MRSGVPSTVVPAWITLEPDLLTAAAFTFWGHLGEYIRDNDLIYKHCVCGACKYRADHSSVGIVLSGELSMIANIIKMFGSVMKYFID